MANTDASSPTFTQQVDQSVFVEPLGGPTNPLNALDRFPDAIYHKSPDTHFVKFMYSLLGPAGVGWIKKNYLEAKLELYAHGFSSFHIEKYYGDPFRFGRILLEELPEDPEGLLTREQWDTIRSRDESYRGRAITYFNAARAGGTPEGMALAAQSGLNHTALIVENYKALFDAHSDEPLGLPHYGQTESTEEFIVIPRQDTSRSEQQIISFADVTATEGTFQLEFNGQRTTLIDYTADRFEVEEALSELGQIGEGNVIVTGGPGPNPFIVTFTGRLSNQDVPTLKTISSLVDNLGDPVAISVRVLVGGIEPVDEVVHLSDEYQHNAQTAIDFLRPLNSLPTMYDGRATRTRQDWRSVQSSSSFVETVKFVTGSENVQWPSVNSVNWIETGKEKQAQRLQGDLQAHYTSYHSIANLVGYTDDALKDPIYGEQTDILAQYKSEHIGQYDPRATGSFSFLAESSDNSELHSAMQATPACPMPMEVTTVDNDTLSPLVEGTVNANALALDGSGGISLQKRKWWSSLERTAPATEFLEIDLGTTRVVNWITFDISRKPFFIDIDYDHLDSQPSGSNPRSWKPITLWPLGEGSIVFWEGITYPVGIFYSPTMPPWQTVKVFFHDEEQHNIATRFLRLKFVRPLPNAHDLEAPFQNVQTEELIPYSVDVRNLRVGRYAGSTPTWNSVI